MTKSKNTMIFIDYGNLYHNAHELKFKVDYGKLISVLGKNKNVIKAIMYMGVIYPIKGKKIGWIKSLKRKYGINIKYRYLKETPQGFKEKGVDVLLAIDMLINAYENNYDIAVLLSGDADFIPVIEKIQALNKKVELWCFKDSVAWRLVSKVNKKNVMYLNKVIDKIKK